MRCETWWTPGVALIGEAAHAIDPEAGVGAGLGFGDALALAVAVAGAADADAACRDYEFWRRPVVAPYEAIGAAGARMVRGGERPDEERWPPVGIRPRSEPVGRQSSRRGDPRPRRRHRSAGPRRASRPRSAFRRSPLRRGGDDGPMDASIGSSGRSGRRM